MSTLCQGPHRDERTKDNPLQVCRRCRHFSLIAIRSMPECHRTLELQLVPTNKQGQPITMTRNPGIHLDTEVVETRTKIVGFLRAWAAITMIQRAIPVTAKPNDLDGLSRYLMTHHTWILETGNATSYVEHALTIYDKATKLIEANPVRTYPIGQCPHCPGILIAQMRPLDPLLPAIIVCNQSPTDEHGQPEHAWTADKWAALGRNLT